MLHQPLAHLPVVQSAWVDPQSLRNLAIPLRGRVVVECHHMFDQHGVADTMGQVEVAAEAVGHGMHRAENRVGEG